MTLCETPRTARLAPSAVNHTHHVVTATDGGGDLTAEIPYE